MIPCAMSYSIAFYIGCKRSCEKESGSEREKSLSASGRVVTGVGSTSTKLWSGGYGSNRTYILCFIGISGNFSACFLSCIFGKHTTYHHSHRASYGTSTWWHYVNMSQIVHVCREDMKPLQLQPALCRCSANICPIWNSPDHNPIMFRIIAQIERNEYALFKGDVLS